MASTKKTTKKTTAKKSSSAKRTSSAKKAASKKRASNTKSATAKKTSKKKSSSKKRDGKALVCADEQECFWTTDGQILKDLIELRDALQHMQNEVYHHHVSRAKNDFAEWVEHVLQDADCAAALRSAQKPHTARLVVVRCLRNYNL